MKARDLRGKNIEDIEAEEPKQEDDAVAAAYENISKRLESIRGGKSDEEEDDEGNEAAEGRSGEKEEPELTEWKGPRPPKKEDLKEIEEGEEEEGDLRKVKLNNLEDSGEAAKRPSDEDEEIDPLDDEDEDDDEPKNGAKKDWEPEEGDPLDEEDDDDSKMQSGRDAEKEDLEVKDDKDVEGEMGSNREESVKEETAVADEEQEEMPRRMSRDEDEGESESLHSEVRRPQISEPSDMPEDRDLSDSRRGPDTLDDLTDDPMERRPMREESGEDDYSIPHLRSSRQEGAGMGYNANPQRESFGQSYGSRGNMDGNDPNNFFSSHQNQAPKRANKFHLLVLVIIGIVVIGFTVYVLKGGFGGISLGTPEPSPSPSATATPEPTPTPTPEPEVERGNFTVRVLNGTSTSGLAGKIRDSLKEKGYKTANPGNAPDDDVEQTEIRVKEGTESAALFERLKLDLAPDYDAVQGEALDSKAAYDAEVIIGAK